MIDYEKLKRTANQQRYLETEAGKQTRARDNERKRLGYLALRAQGFSAEEARQGARQAARSLVLEGQWRGT